MIKYKHLKDNDRWMLAEHIPDIDFFFSQIWLSSFVNDLKKSCGKNYKKVLAIFHPKFHMHFYYGEKDSLEFEKYLVGKIKKNPEFGFKINKNIIKHSDKLREFCQNIEKIDFNNLTNKKLWILLDKQDKIHTELYTWGWLSNATDMFHATFTNELNGYLNRILSKIKKQNKLNKIFNILSSPHKKSVALCEEENLLKIANFALNNPGKSRKIKEMILDHWKKYFYLKHLWLGKNGVYSIEYYNKEINKLKKDKIKPIQKIEKINKDLEKIKIQKTEILKEFKIPRKYLDLFDIYSEFMLTKIYRRYAQLFWAYEMRKLLNEIGKRLNLSLDDVRHMLPKEIKNGLLDGKINRIEIKKRTDFLLYYAEKGKELISIDKNNFLYKSTQIKTDYDVDELEGQIACMGYAKGIVKIINSPKDMVKMRTGDILVSIATNPDLVSAMKKAVAIITEQGGVTSHAAIVSREMKIPCIIGTKIATTVLKDGDLVEVDANNGIVKIIKS